MDVPRHPELGHLELLEYLALLWPDRSRRVLQTLFAAGRIRSGGRPVGARARAGDLRDLTLVGTLDGIERIPCWPEVGAAGELSSSGETSSVPPDAAALIPRILHEDSRLLALEKPSGLPVVPDRSRSAASCLGFLIRRELEERKQKSPEAYVRYRIVHRIDRLTSGLVIVAKTPDAERLLSADFEGRRVRKEYLALLAGEVRPARVSVNCPVVPGRKGKMRAEGTAEDRATWPARSALTEFEVLERLEGVTLVRARPRTGKTHQIRVHAWAIGHPLAVDPVYGGVGVARSASGLPGAPGGAAVQGAEAGAVPSAPAVQAPPVLDRLTLHALRYELPESWEEPRSFECPLPSDFQEALARLRSRRDAGGSCC